MTDRYGVIGNPVAHSRSPYIHARFAEQVGHALSYEAVLAPLDGFSGVAGGFRAAGGRGLNVTVPFKQEAYALATVHSTRAARALAVNTLRFDADGSVLGDNTDGVGLVRDLTVNLHLDVRHRRVLLLGAGGAARGVLGPLLDLTPAELVVANRTPARARALAADFAGDGAVGHCTFEALVGERFDLLINATAAGLSGEVPALPSGCLASGAVGYDMMYASSPTAFVCWAREQGAAMAVDGLGMLVEQAAESFFVWRGVRPLTIPVIAELRAALAVGR